MRRSRTEVGFGMENRTAFQGFFAASQEGERRNDG
jgi:hypothetical protein